MKADTHLMDEERRQDMLLGCIFFSVGQMDRNHTLKGPNAHIRENAAHFHSACSKRKANKFFIQGGHMLETLKTLWGTLWGTQHLSLLHQWPSNWHSIPQRLKRLWMWKPGIRRERWMFRALERSWVSWRYLADRFQHVEGRLSGLDDG